ncbi:hypothetical protein EI42_05946 [Thermosporothrix hazakensis]|jgi:hypothetical protein|uniref:Uncharacterized protein n=1 Tax=Thermosporothrix hazakensis TaxID=644383 RepID=A0A326U6F9_THEHA|nr:hypothetical protein EI42_05946 [Thermosporothrix hazakensis]GCE48587.1 hypothetical protein KTH_34560 [Thermosporothrix hazakensis]
MRVDQEERISQLKGKQNRLNRNVLVFSREEKEEMGESPSTAPIIPYG